ncbi:alkane 1-monooxygenase [Conexibacter sp. JD483]|uniref:alkane 1-monooxygenase n=1 Tax=unclassified Conexibacter TaxID=2627773 RepID=UPI00271E254B|nr:MULTISPECIES: alkane 1-monooxygenase [unclassified Conexibacter]MDO8185180.1 alkane 1-monooxygenase [Conexibacter sp. CPCC 205706]MDO8198226.1 alkane 1-monooxygenase [Conexibacter sp. CPCC 205762]MDR9367812.1 alkane 1-monooxygenase [Conexibacter sp. JD483]
MSSVAHGDEAGQHHHHHDDGVELTPATWKDGKRYAWLLGLLVPTLPFIAYGLVQATGLGVFWFFGPFLVFGIFPLADLIVGMDARNPPDSVIKWLEQDRYYRWCTYAYIPIQYAGLIFACVQWSSGDLSVVDSIGLALTMAMVSGIAINTAHELGHKRASLERWLSKVALAQSGYGHFFIEHNRGHHVRVATPEDPASSRLGESFWAFLPRTVKGSLTSAWELEGVRLDRLGARHVSLKNDIINAWLMTVVLFAALTAVFGWVVLPYLLLQAVIGFSLLEVVNYLEHYGLLRQKREDGRYERTRPEHSWNSNNVASNVLLYHLQRHSDHHANPMRRYQALRHMDEAPQLPTGYAGMIVLATIPPLWRRVMDRRLLEHYGADVTRTNIQPRKRAKLVARYGATA